MCLSPYIHTFFFLAILGFELRGLTLARQMLFYFEPLYQPFLLLGILKTGFHGP
jgi:hypothetical protein